MGNSGPDEGPAGIDGDKRRWTGAVEQDAKSETPVGQEKRQ